MSSSKIDEVNDYFKIPIFYNKKKIQVNKNIINDLELIQTIDPSTNTSSPVYEYCFNNDNIVSKKINEQMVEYYTTDTKFLKENQILLKEYKPLGVKYTDYSPNYQKIVDIWDELKVDTGFKERYYFIEWEMLEFLNRSQWFLQFMSIYNLLSPVISLLVPIIILIIPFVVIKMKGLTITISEYIDVLKIVASQNAIGKLFVTNFNDINAQEKLYIFISAAFYLFSVYQNFMVCVRFNNNMKLIHNHFNELKIYLEHTTQSMENYLKYSKDLVTQNEFNISIREKLDVLYNIQNKIQSITEYNMFNISKVKEIGYVFKCFYELHTDKLYDDCIMFSLGFNGYLDCLKGLQQNIIEKKMSFTKFIKNSKKNIFNKSYYAPFKNEKPVKNTIKLNKNMIITGPNASGKTTILKSTIINILFSQQFGCGFYESAQLKPYKYLHCYLNIPDTSGRDSLFQAEARRCKEILDTITSHPKDTHFCTFDELYSGTNPEEAEQSATAFMNYIIKYSNVSCMLTTHFYKVCDKLDKHTEIINYQMKTDNENNKLVYKYKLIKGISRVKGGVLVLKQMNYPDEIVNANLV